MEPSARRLRLETTVRGIVIAVLLGFYGLVVGDVGVSWVWSLLVGAALQILVLVLRRVVPPDLMPQAAHVFEMLADAVTVFLFALGVYGGILKASHLA
jgi:hypothetical protein